MTDCNPSDPECLATLTELSDDALLAYASLHVSLDSRDLIEVLAFRVRNQKQEIENWRSDNWRRSE